RTFADALRPRTVSIRLRFPRCRWRRMNRGAAHAFRKRMTVMTAGSLSALWAVFSLCSLCAPAAAMTDCQEVPSSVNVDTMEITPAHPMVGDDVEVSFSLTVFAYSLGAETLLGAAPVFEGDTELERDYQPRFHLIAARPGTATLQ